MSVHQTRFDGPVPVGTCAARAKVGDAKAVRQQLLDVTMIRR
jgi:hypothetical protein